MQLAKIATLKVAAVMKRSRAKSRDDIMALMHVTYSKTVTCETRLLDGQMLYSMKCADANMSIHTCCMSAQMSGCARIMNCGRNLKRTQKVHSALLFASG